MNHLGDITKINGAEIEPVDVIVGGSPCQDLSVAGKRAGLEGERSGLFMEQIRIIIEMRKTYGADRPRYMVWENVPGAFSSNKCEDFRIVLEETARVADQTAIIPQPPKRKWRNSGAIMGDGWSIAWRVLDAQFWGVPQRRRRIALVADFGGQSAPEILFVRYGVSRDIAESGEAGKGTAKDAARGVGEAVAFAGGGFCNFQESDIASTQRACISKQTDVDLVVCFEPGAITRDMGNRAWAEQCPTLRAEMGDNQPAVCIENHPNDSRVKIREDGTVQALTGRMGTGGGNVPMVMESTYQETTGPLMANSHPGSYCGQDAYQDMFVTQPIVAGLDCRSGVENGDICGTLQAKPNGGFSHNCIHPVRIGHTVRRLTPTECERLQGYPDGWTDIGDYIDSNGKKKKSNDSARYKALGNSIALPPWKWVLKRISAQYERDATLGSLFDGIGGFPLIWEQINGKGSCRWASEIEEFPIAVTKLHFE